MDFLDALPWGIASKFTTRSSDLEDQIDLLRIRKSGKSGDTESDVIFS
jgi:hypothetical protein